MEGLQGQRSSMKVTLTDADHHGELAVKDTIVKLEKLEASRQ